MPPVKKKIDHESEIKTPSYGLLKLGGISEVLGGNSPKGAWNNLVPAPLTELRFIFPLDTKPVTAECYCTWHVSHHIHQNNDGLRQWFLTYGLRPKQWSRSGQEWVACNLHQKSEQCLVAQNLGKIQSFYGIFILSMSYDIKVLFKYQAPCGTLLLISVCPENLWYSLADHK